MAVDLSFENNDLSLDSTRDIATVSDGDQVVSHVNARLKTVLGENYYDTTIGIPWFEAMYTIATSYEQKSAIVRQTIIRTPEVRKLNTYSYGINREERKAVIEYNGETDYSTAIADTVEI